MQVAPDVETWRLGMQAPPIAGQPRQLPKSGRLCRLPPTKVSLANRQLQKVEGYAGYRRQQVSLDHNKLQKVEGYAGYRRQLRFRIHDRDKLVHK
jgi:hypothetical protein